MPEQKVDSYARRLDRPVQQAVHDNSAAGTEKRYGSLAKDFTDADSLRRLAGAIRQHQVLHGAGDILSRRAGFLDVARAIQAQQAARGSLAFRQACHGK